MAAVALAALLVVVRPWKQNPAAELLTQAPPPDPTDAAAVAQRTVSATADVQLTQRWQPTYDQLSQLPFVGEHAQHQKQIRRRFGAPTVIAAAMKDA